MRVVRVGPPSGRWHHQRVVLDGGPTLRIRAEDVEALGLEAGVELTEDALTALRSRAEVVRATESALRLLAVRLRSRREVENRLRQRGTAPGVIRDLVDRLVSDGFLDDARFARAWIQGRLAVRPSGGLRLRGELLRKGVAPEIIEQALREAFADTDEHQLALLVAQARARRYRSQPAEVAYRRLAGVLQRRGFSPGAVAAALRTVFGRAVVTE